MKALVLHDGDHVAVAVGNGGAGQECWIQNVNGTTSTVTLRSDVPFGHKLAVRDIAVGETVSKYGQPIGVATQDISVGMHVHTHNLGGHRANLRGESQ
ncbi:UxaA family hydrolase [Burkholderia cepacia]|uniref:UxaA family hydrolase n=1 Tax=Burkholderia cepacia TaxID=292 RepID=UPI0009B63C11|nr:UxaA family hydrolase [Burkholderia cepacia]